jgi:hypothetical protein
MTACLHTWLWTNLARILLTQHDSIGICKLPPQDLTTTTLSSTCLSPLHAQGACAAVAPHQLDCHQCTACCKMLLAYYR